MDKRVLEPVGPTLGQEQSLTEQAQVTVISYSNQENNQYVGEKCWLAFASLAN